VLNFDAKKVSNDSFVKKQVFATGPYHTNDPNIREDSKKNEKFSDLITK